MTISRLTRSALSTVCLRGTLTLALSGALVVAGCDSGERRAADSAASAVTTDSIDAAGAHLRPPPHGGMLVELGEEFAHLEFVLDSSSGVLTAFVLDRGARNPVRLSQGRLDIRMQGLVEGNVEAFVVLAGKADRLTSETELNTSVFFGFVPELKGKTRFRGVLQKIDVNGRVFTDIPVVYPPEPRV